MSKQEQPTQDASVRYWVIQGDIYTSAPVENGHPTIKDGDRTLLATGITHREPDLAELVRRANAADRNLNDLLTKGREALAAYKEGE